MRNPASFKLGPHKDDAVLLYDGVQSPTAVVGPHVFAIACDSKAKTDRLLQIPSAGGATETVAELPRASQDRCQYSSLVADERDVFVADWNGYGIIAVSRADKSVRNVVSKRGFPGPLLLEPDAVVFASALGLFRVSRDGGKPTRLASTDIALAPYSLIAESPAAYWVFDAFAYTTATTLFRIPRAGGAPKSFMVLHNADPNAESFDDQGLQDFVLDDECVYVAQTQFKRAGVQIVVKELQQ